MSPLRQWAIRSNDGWNEVRFAAQLLHDHTEVIEYFLELTGKSWYRPPVKPDPPDNDTLVDDFRIALPTVLIPFRACEQLLDDFDRWLQCRTPFVRDLGGSPHDLISFDIAHKTPSFITSLDHPQFTFSYSVRRCRLEVFFVTDPSCIQMAREELAATLQSLQTS